MWLTEFIQRPGMVELLNSSDAAGTNIMSSKCITELKGANGHPFVNSSPGNLGICLGLFIDWFNANRNTIRGSNHGTGGIYIVVLNLPESIRFEPENMFHMFIPGPKEPTTERLSNFMRPLVQELIALFERGLVLQAAEFILRCYAMLALIIADLKAAKKIGGYAASNHKWFCALCRQNEAGFRTNLESDKWDKMLSNDAHRRIMLEWRNSKTPAERKKHFGLYGIRYSELERLPYLDFSKAISLEPMHALHNIMEPHIRRIFKLGAKEQMDAHKGGNIDGVAAEEEKEWNFADSSDEDDHCDDFDMDEDSELDDDGFETCKGDHPAHSNSDKLSSYPKEVARGEIILHRTVLDQSSISLLGRMHVDTLEILCSGRGISFFQLLLHGGRPTKQAMTEALIDWVCYWSSNC
jgi:Transposase family tnp2